MISDRDFAQWCCALTEALSREPLPGALAHRAMAPRPRQLAPPGGSNPPRPGGVLLLLHPDDEGICLPVTLRTEGVAYHKGQISLPGGMQEHGDANLADTALRETFEEIGVRPEEVRILGKLTPLYVPASHSCIHPFVACHSTKPLYRANPHEVAEVIELPLRTLMDPTAQAEEEREIQGQLVKVPFYWLKGHKVWGATAMILSEFAAILAQRPELGRVPGLPAC